MVEAQKWLEENYPKEGVCQRKDYWGKEDYGKTREQITELDISEQDLEGSLNLTDFVNLTKLNCFDNYLTELDLTGLTKLEQIACFNNYLTNIIYPDQAEQLTYLDIENNNLPKQDFSVFNRFSNLERLEIGNSDLNKEKINHNIYNRFTGSLEPLKNLTELRQLDISNTDIDSGVEYLPESLEEIDYNTWYRPTCKLVEIKVQLDQHYWKDIHEDFIDYEENKILKKDWLEQGFTKEQTKEWITVGAEPDGINFIIWLINTKKVDLVWALENEEEFIDLRDKYEYFGTCKECQQPNGGWGWCKTCNAKHFQDEFSNWSSGNIQVDQFIRKCQLEATSNWNVLEWIPYENFTNIEHIADGGFGKVYKAGWEEGVIERWDNEKKEWERNKDYNDENRKHKDYKTVALKTLTNSQNLNNEFLTELILYKRFKSEVSNMVPCYGISQDTKGNYIMVMEYMKEGNLKGYLKKNYRELNFEKGEYSSKYLKLNLLKQIALGLKDIHRKDLVHRDFHSGNIIVGRNKYGYYECKITDLGLSKPVDEVDDSKVFGVLPYVAPEVLQGKPYTQASDVYSFGIIAYEILTCSPPFANQAHDLDLSLKICRGERPQFPPQVKYPQLVVDLIKRCWAADPEQRSTMKEISEIMGEWFYGESGDGENGIYHSKGDLKTDTTFYQQLQEAQAYNKTLPEEIRYLNYQPKEVWHSKLINTKQITELLQQQKIEECHTGTTDELTLDKFDQITIQDQEQHQPQIQIPPK